MRQSIFSLRSVTATLILISILQISNVFSQTNLIRNGSFESYWRKPDNQFQITRAKYWNSAQQYSVTNTQDYYRCYIRGASEYYLRDIQRASGWANVPVAIPGLFSYIDGLRQPYGWNSLNPTWQNGYASFQSSFRLDTTCTNTNWEYREYVQQELLNPLIGQHKYHVSFRISLGDVNGKNTKNYGIKNDDVGALFTTDRVYQNDGTCPPILNIPQIHGKHYDNGSSTVEYLTAMGGVNGTGPWQIIEGNIQVPSGVDYKYITIGCFLGSVPITDFKDQYNNIPTPPYPDLFYPCADIYYFVDSVQVYEIPVDTLDCCSFITITPNAPTTDSFGNCCYKFLINSTGDSACAPTSFKIYETGTPNQWQITSPVMGNSYPATPICLPRGSGTHHYMFAFTKPNGDTCQKHIDLDCGYAMCPCPVPGMDDWLKVEVKRDGTCGFGCRVFMNLELPDSITCFKHYFYEYESSTSPMYHLDGPFMTPVWQNSFCMDNNSSSSVSLHLFNDDYTSECIVSKDVTCDSSVVQDSIPNNCTPDCPDDSIWTHDTKKIVLSSGCEIEVEYSYRYACPNTVNMQDLQINSIRVIGNCSPLTQKELYQKALMDLIYYNPMGFDPQFDEIGCSTVWRVIQSSCWKLDAIWVFDPATGGHVELIMIPCKITACCIQQYMVCRNISSVVIRPIGAPYTEDMVNCPKIRDSLFTTYPPYKLFFCHTTCDWLNLGDSLVITISHKESMDFNNENTVTGYQCNFESGNLVITNNNHNNSTIRVEIYDLLGKLVNQTAKNTNQNSIKIDFNNLVSLQGVYMYRVYVNDAIYCYGKYIK